MNPPKTIPLDHVLTHTRQALALLDRIPPHLDSWISWRDTHRHHADFLDRLQWLDRNWPSLRSRAAIHVVVLQQQLEFDFSKRRRVVRRAA